MREADRLARDNPDLTIKLLNQYKGNFVELVDKIRINNLLGHSYVKVSKFNEAMNCYKIVFSEAPLGQQKVGALFSLAFIYRKKGDYQSAIESLNKIIAIDKSKKQHIEELLNQIERIKGNVLKLKAPDGISKALEDSNFLDNELLNTSRLFSLGSPIDEISDFLEIEIDQAKIEGLGQKKIETKEFTLKDIEYLQREGSDLVRANKPKLAATYFLSAVKIINYLNLNESQVAEYLRNYCVAKGSASVIDNNNWDVARTYYSEVFRFSTNFVFLEKQFFDPKETLNKQSEINLSLFLSTFYRSKETFLAKADWPIFNLLEILQIENEKIVFAVLNALILLASYNPIIGKYLIVMARRKNEILDKLIYYFSKMYDRPLENNDYCSNKAMVDIASMVSSKRI